MLILRKEAEAEEQSKHVREVGERAARAVVMRLHRPHVGVQQRRVQPIAIGLFLRVEHQPVELVHRELTPAPALEDTSLEEEATGDVYHYLRAALQRRLQDQQL